eukprot:s5404_g8.t2
MLLRRDVLKLAGFTIAELMPHRCTKLVCRRQLTMGIAAIPRSIDTVKLPRSFGAPACRRGLHRNSAAHGVAGGVSTEVLQVHPHPEPALSFVDLTSSTRLEGVRNKITSFALHALLRGAYPCLGARLVGVFA